MTRMRKLAVAAACALLLAGCGEGDVREVKQWMAQTRAQTSPMVKPLEPPKEFSPFSYTAGDAQDPFSKDRLMVELAQSGGADDSPFRPDMNRPKEPLEYYPLDVMRMAGTIRKGGVIYAMLEIDRTKHLVRVGQRIGQNYGVVTSVTDTSVDVRETVQDASGEWVERMAKLELQESKENTK